ncbi:GvpL/GvpF family gas vesicle protein [Nonomuraea sp. SYSU D8015]|uniref:GvpL/GvpF family gas vesicle protein n=1 Tax=Nonomuraea sp. SYSU D8015 TaxID=2593644 RepID=UPI0016614F8B|nr:GvpL/GvpF family gas vesicle protein [Nonomuraea sp. SYSU D8015]
MSDVGTYLYAVALDEDAAPAEGLTGVAGEPVRAIAHAGLVAYVSAVPLSEFGEEPLRQSLEDMDWLGETARAHHRVVEAVAAKAPTAPVRLVTVYNDEAQIRALLERRRDDFVRLLSRVAGRREWGVKVYVAPSAPPPAAAEPAAHSSPGTAYLKKRQASLHTREEAWRQGVERAERIHDVLSSVAVAGHRHRPQDPQLSGREEWMVLNGAYLVDEGRAEEFGRVVEGLRGEGIDVELTGPWAPYSFTTPVDTKESEDRDARS